MVYDIILMTECAVYIVGKSEEFFCKIFLGKWCGKIDYFSEKRRFQAHIIVTGSRYITHLYIYKPLTIVATNLIAYQQVKRPSLPLKAFLTLHSPT